MTNARCFVPLAVALSGVARAQDESGLPDNPAAAEDNQKTDLSETYQNTIAGEFTPGRGFTLLETERGSVNVSVYALVRYLNQMPGEQTFEDHLGNEHTVNARHDINWHRSFVWISGFFWNPKLQYTLSIWSLPTTEQTLVFGLLRYTVGRGLSFGAGIGPNLTARSMQGSWPFWASSDRQMAEEFYRGGFSSAAFVTGEPLSRLFYTASINRSLTQLGIPASQDNRFFAYSGSVWTMPTTGEFGPRGGFGDLEHHERLASRFGVSGAWVREGRFAQNDQPPREAQIKMSDGISPYDRGALAAGVTVEELDYAEIAGDIGAKYRGWSFQGEYGVRHLSNFQADGPIPLDSILDQGFYAQAGYMVVPKHVLAYATVGYIFDQFDRRPWEISGGASYYPYGNRNWRLNFHYIHIERSPTGSSFGFYTAGQTGNTIAINTDVLL